VRFTGDTVLEFIVSMVLASSIFLAVLGVVFRVGIRPVLLDWIKHRNQSGNPALERRLAEMEEDIRQLKMASNLQLPAEVRASSRPRT